MKKTYMRPTVVCCEMVVPMSLCSVSGGGGGVNVGYGGVDNDGELDPDAKERIANGEFDQYNYWETGLW